MRTVLAQGAAVTEVMGKHLPPDLDRSTKATLIAAEHAARVLRQLGTTPVSIDATAVLCAATGAGLLQTMPPHEVDAFVTRVESAVLEPDGDPMTAARTLLRERC